MSNQKLVMLKGLPGCGKTTYANELVDKEGYKRVNKDDLRAMIDNSKWSRENEMHIGNIECDIVKRIIKEGFNVVVDDTNFAYEEMWSRIAKEYKIDFEVKFFDVPVSECLKRNSLRTGKARVEDKVIWNMYNKYLKPQPIKRNDLLEDVYIFDIDGTLALMDGRSPYDYSKVNTDKENANVTCIFRFLRDTGYGIYQPGGKGWSNRFKFIIVSGRESSCIEETKEWLKTMEINYDELHMRETGDKRDDRIVKREIYENHIEGKYNVNGVFDDRDRVVEMWRSLGLTCFQVDYGPF